MTTLLVILVVALGFAALSILLVGFAIGLAYAIAVLVKIVARAF